MLNKLQAKFFTFWLFVRGDSNAWLCHASLFLNLFIYAWLDLASLVCDFFHTVLSYTYPLGPGKGNGNSQSMKPFETA